MSTTLYFSFQINRKTFFLLYDFNYYDCIVEEAHSKKTSLTTKSSYYNTANGKSRSTNMKLKFSTWSHTLTVSTVYLLILMLSDKILEKDKF